MPGKKSAALVIDTTVTSAAAETDHPVSSACRSFLQEVLNVCHRVVITSEILAEYKEHRSYFAYRWLTSMWARRKVVRLDAVQNLALRQTVRSLRLTDNDRGAIMKDIHFIEAALAADQRVASLDRKARRHFREITEHFEPLRSLVWVDPTNDDEHATDWLRQGANADGERQLGFSP